MKRCYSIRACMATRSSDSSPLRCLSFVTETTTNASRPSFPSTTCIMGTSSHCITGMVNGFHSIMALWNIFLEIVANVLKLAERMGLSLPSYAIDLVPCLCYKLSPEDPPFSFQFLPFFSPSVLRAWWCHIARITILLEGYINLCT